MAASSPLRWLPGVHQPGAGSSSAQGPSWTPPAGIGGSAPTAENLEDHDLQAWGLDSHPPGGFLSYFKNTSSHAQGTSSQPINVGDVTNGDDCARTEKRLTWTEQEDCRLVSAWLNNSNDPIQSNFRKNDQYWKEVAAVYNSTTPKNRAREVKQLKDRFAKIKKKVAWFCASWKEANALCEEPKWVAYLERLEDVEPDKRKFSVDVEVRQHFNLEEARDERPTGGKKAKDERKRKRKDQDCIIDLDDELSKLVDVQNAANEGRKEMLETQRRVSSENLEAKKLACLAAKDHKESVMLETYRSLMMQDTTRMPEDVRAEHVLALKCLRESIFCKNDHDLDMSPVSAPTSVHPGEVVAPEIHDTRRDGVVTQEGEDMAPEDHDTGRDGVVMLETGDVMTPEYHNIRCGSVITLEDSEDVSPEEHGVGCDGVVAIEEHEMRRPSLSPHELGTYVMLENATSCCADILSTDVSIALEDRPDEESPCGQHARAHGADVVPNEQVDAAIGRASNKGGSNPSCAGTKAADLLTSLCCTVEKPDGVGQYELYTAAPGLGLEGKQILEILQGALSLESNVGGGASVFSESLETPKIRTLASLKEYVASPIAHE
ncbi:Ribosomal protein-like [Hordeum vulgare]|nr:Ribosomal protein-like [Hordeum vulgare]